MAHSSLATVSVPASTTNYTKGRNTKISAISIHHMAGVLSAQQCGEIFARAGRGASTHYGVGADAKIGVYVEEENTAWANANWAANCRTVNIETANSATGGDWPVSQATFTRLVELVADIAKRNNLGTLVKGKNLVWHSMYYNTNCPGTWLLNHMDELVSRANALINGSGSTTTTTTSTKKSDSEIANEVIAGKWGNGDNRKAKLEAAGYNYSTVQSIVNTKLGYSGSTTKAVSASSIVVGDRVTLTNWVDYNGTKLAKTRNYYFVSEINGDRCVLRADSMKGAVYAAVKKSNLKEV